MTMTQERVPPSIHDWQRVEPVRSSFRCATAHAFGWMYDWGNRVACVAAALSVPFSQAGTRTLATILRVLVWTLVVAAATVSTAAPAGDISQSHTALAAAFKNVKGTLESGLKAAEQMGTPISAKFILEHTILRLSLWIAKDDGFSEFNLYPAIGMINEVVDIADPEKIEAATAQKLAVASATISLVSATESAVKVNKGFRAISVLPMLSEGRPVAVVTLLGPDEFRVVTEKLYRFGF